MRKIVLGSAMAVALVAIGSSAYAFSNRHDCLGYSDIPAHHDSNEYRYDEYVGSRFIDLDNNGICDHYEFYHQNQSSNGQNSPSQGQGNQNGQGQNAQNQGNGNQGQNWVNSGHQGQHYGHGNAAGYANYNNHHAQHGHHH